MLEAREVTNGATGRNGGHMKVTLYELFSSMKAKFGIEAAKKIVRFQIRQCGLLVDMAEKEGWSAGQARMVETADFFWDHETWTEVKEMVEELREGMPELAEDVVVWEGEDAIQVRIFL